MVIIETPIFTRRIQAILADDEYRLLQAQLLQNRTLVRSFRAAEDFANSVGRQVVAENVAVPGLFIIGLCLQRSF
jgi:hypothetical protein